MPTVYPFRAVTFALNPGSPRDLSDLVAPPYDVLDTKSKAALLAANAKNIVAIDLPHLPAKELGPTAAYEGAAKQLQAMLAEGTLVRQDKPAMFVYRETFTFGGVQHRRTGMTCTIDVKPFGPAPGGGILPHEETFSGPKEDRMALMKSTAAQLSPIFGLHQDASGKAAKLTRDICATRPPDMFANTADGTLHEAWVVHDGATQNKYAEALAGEDIFIADGHHRYTTAINYLKGLEMAGGIGPDHPARKCMFVMISMSDTGMVIGPTHRVLGGMSSYSFENFAEAAKGHLKITPAGSDLMQIERAMSAQAMATGNLNALGLYDFATKRCFVAQPATSDPLAARFPAKVKAWRTLDVALVQYLVVEGICQPALNANQPVKWAFPHSIDEVAAIGAGQEKGSGGGKDFVPQIAVIVRPTPLEAVRAVSRAGELMPQKSTFFYPKLATGLFLNPLK